MANDTYILQVSLRVKDGTPREAWVIRWLSGNLDKDEWSQLCRDMGRRKILALPVLVLGLASTGAYVIEKKGASTIGDVAALSRAQLEKELNPRTLGGIVNRLDRFGLELAP